MSFIFPGPVVLEKKIFIDFSYIFLCKTWVGHFGPTFDPGGHDLNKLKSALPEDDST
jgi:hypothetical protein